MCKNPIDYLIFWLIAFVVSLILGLFLNITFERAFVMSICILLGNIIYDALCDINKKFK